MVLQGWTEFTAQSVADLLRDDTDRRRRVSLAEVGTELGQHPHLRGQHLASGGHRRRLKVAFHREERLQELLLQKIHVHAGVRRPQRVADVLARLAGSVAVVDGGAPGFATRDHLQVHLAEEARVVEKPLGEVSSDYAHRHLPAPVTRQG
jgi:hypothetical protein